MTNVDKSGRRLDISFKLKSPDGRIANFQGRKPEGSLLSYESKQAGTYEICFNNRYEICICVRIRIVHLSFFLARYSMMEMKRVFFQFEVEGMEDAALEEEKNLNQTIAEFQEQSKVVRRAVIQVRSKVSRMRHQQWRLESNMKKDQARAEALTGMT